MPLAWAPASILELRMVLGGVWRRGPGWLPGPAGSLPCGRSRVLSRSPRYLEVVLPLRAFLCKCFLASVENKSCCRPAAFLTPPLVLLVVPSSGLCVCVCPLPVGPAFPVLFGRWASAISQVLVALPSCRWATLQYLAFLCQPGAPFLLAPYLCTDWLPCSLPACFPVSSPTRLGEFAALPSIPRALPQ